MIGRGKADAFLKKRNLQPPIPTPHIIRPRAPLDIRLPLPHLLHLPLGRHLIRSRDPIPHRTRQHHHPILPLILGPRGSMRDDILLEPAHVSRVRPVGRSDRAGAIAALFEGNVAVGGVVVGGV